MTAPMSTHMSHAEETPVDVRTAARRRRRGAVLARVVLAVASGVLLYLSFQPRPLWWLAPLGFAGLFWVLSGRGARAGFGYGLLAGLGWMVPLLWWTGEFVGPIAAIPLAVLQAALVGVATAGIAVVTRLPAAPVWAALLWVAGETLRALVPFGGFPWAKIAFSQPEGGYLSLAALGGTPLVAFAVSVTGFGAAQLARRCVAGRDRRPARLAVPLLAAVVPLTAGWAVGPLVGVAPEAGEVTVAVVQGNVPRAGLDFNAQRRAVLDNHVRRTVELAEEVRAGQVRRPDLVIWPENSSDIDPYRNPDAFAAIDRAAKAIGAPIAVGAVLGGDTDRPRNTAILWDPQRGPIEEYTKRRLQPFGETMPLRSFFRIFSDKVDRAGRFVPGTDPRVFAMSKARVGIAMCYEVAFDAAVRDSVTAGATLLAVPSNNATFGFTEMTYQQLAMDRLRAVEHGRAVVVATTSGVSAIIRPDGTVAQRTSLFTPAALVETVPLRTSVTVADRLGALPEWIMVVAGMAGLAGAWSRRRRQAPV
ncbi:Apolipoprotein N-acyltransferase in lipid-linked oligosaccharide synthesis cluster [Alloactinosynnema sp. L-07]|uniref:apolipoprotein N-acyltransferase n=1 Tax=Alloactinosynnema sp. L-07 TaxID=1653480 RepID=UPI00065F0746|nr:apolipoprotein N-acyltransferase [Alloactinosynnema sp. L-07]CRK55332.1 Apolipoprotein N-acyltransferase in lipid-linked oligosaccharide synthesis cluster [Alloactinosynnema sp. L-07]